MFIIAEEDIGKVQRVVNQVLAVVALGTQRVVQDVDVGNGLPSLVVSGYWVVDTIRIDIRIKK